MLKTNKKPIETYAFFNADFCNSAGEEYIFRRTYEIPKDADIMKDGFLGYTDPVSLLRSGSWMVRKRFAVIDQSGRMEVNKKEKTCRSSKMRIIAELSLMEFLDTVRKSIKKEPRGEVHGALSCLDGSVLTVGAQGSVGACSGEGSIVFGTAEWSTAAVSNSNSIVYTDHTGCISVASRCDCYAVAAGYSSIAGSTGGYSRAAALGKCSIACIAGNSSLIESLGRDSVAAACGALNHVLSRQPYSVAVAVGDRNNAVSGEHSSLAAVLGVGNTVTAESGSAAVAMSPCDGEYNRARAKKDGAILILQYHSDSKTLTGKFGVAGQDILPDVFYELKAGELVVSQNQNEACECDFRSSLEASNSNNTK